MTTQAISFPPEKKLVLDAVLNSYGMSYEITLENEKRVYAIVEDTPEVMTLVNAIGVRLLKAPKYESTSGGGRSAGRKLDDWIHRSFRLTTFANDAQYAEHLRKVWKTSYLTVEFPDADECTPREQVLLGAMAEMNEYMTTPDDESTSDRDNRLTKLYGAITAVEGLALNFLYGEEEVVADDESEDEEE